MENFTMEFYEKDQPLYGENNLDKIAEFIQKHGAITELNATISHGGNGPETAKKIQKYLKDNYNLNTIYEGVVGCCRADLYYLYDADRFNGNDISKKMIELCNQENCK